MAGNSNKIVNTMPPALETDQQGMRKGRIVGQVI
jgi:hypothetical protein